MSTPHNYRICFDFAAESPRQAVSYLLGIIRDPGGQDLPFEWVVIDTATKQEHSHSLHLQRNGKRGGEAREAISCRI